MILPEPLLKLLVCPTCKSSLRVSNDPPQLACDRCRVAYPVREGIPIMLKDEAIPLGA